jgi:hypothetical protein
MGNIYAAADKTVIYLGRLDNADDSALRNLELYFRQLLAQDASSTKVESLHEQAVKSILSTPWFRRVWILQELVLSKEPLVQYGRHRVSWDEFCRFLGLAKKQGLTKEISTHQLVTKMRDLCERFHRNKGEIRMIDILFSRKGLGVTDPRDMLYAHKGLASDARGLEIDYLESYARLYADISFRAMVTHSNHGILSYVDDGPIFSWLPGLPSWCPDWSQASSIPKLPGPPSGRVLRHAAFRFFDENTPTDEVSKGKVFRARHELFQHQETRVLACLGIEVAIVTHLSDPLSSDSVDGMTQEYFSSKLKSLRQVWRRLGPKNRQFEAANSGHSYGFLGTMESFQEGRAVVSNFSPSTKQHIKSLKDLYVEIYNAWQSIVSNELILPGFDKRIIDGRLLAQTTSSTNSLFFCPTMTAVGDHIFNLLPMSYPDPSFRYFVFRDRLDEELCIKNMRNKNNLNFGSFGRVRNSEGVSDLRRDLPGAAKELAVMTCSFVGEAYGMINMYKEYGGFGPREWRRLSNKSETKHVFSSLYGLVANTADGQFITKEKLLAIF